MADQVIKKRPVVLRLAELQKYPTLDARYAATLPFGSRVGYCNCLLISRRDRNYCGASPSLWYSNNRAECIKRTRERWAWFSSARKLDDTYGNRLGTLNYLPWEIRQNIIEVLFHDPFPYCDHVPFAGDLNRGIWSTLDISFSRHQSYRGLWLASPSTKLEMEQYYFSNTRIEFWCPEDLETFADQISAYEWSLLRSVTLNLKYDDPLRDWMSACARLPPNLVSIHFDVSIWNTMTGAKFHGQWFIIPRGLGALDEVFDLTAILLNTLGRLAHRLAAKAKIGLAAYGKEIMEMDELRYTRTPRYRVLDDLDPWSKDYLSWWEEETKIDVEGDETFNKAA